MRGGERERDTHMEIIHFLVLINIFKEESDHYM